MAAFGLKALHPSSTATDDKPHIIGYSTARTTAGLLVFDVWNGSSSAARVFSIDKDGNVTPSSHLKIASTKKVFLDGGGDTYILEDIANNIAFYAGNSQHVRITATNIQVGGDFLLSATKKLYLDGGTHTYLQESAADTISIVAGGTGIVDMTATTVAFGVQNILVNTGAGVGNGSGVMSFLNATVVPNANPTNGVILYAEGGALKARGASGTVTTIAAA